MVPNGKIFHSSTSNLWSVKHKCDGIKLLTVKPLDEVWEAEGFPYIGPDYYRFESLQNPFDKKLAGYQADQPQPSDMTM